MAKKPRTRVKKRRNWKILWAILALILFPVGFNLYGLTMPKRYTAEMRLMVDETAQTGIVPTGPFAWADQAQLSQRPRSAQTQLDVLTGTTVLQDAYHLAEERLPDKVTARKDPSAVYDDLVRRLAVDNEPMSDILTVRVTEDDPVLAAELANDVGLAYIDYTQKMQKDQATLMARQLKEQIDPLKSKLATIDAQIRDLKDKTAIYDVPVAESAYSGTKENADHTLATALAQYEGTKAQLAVAEAQLKEIPKYVDSGSHTETNPVMLSLQNTLASEKVNLAQLKAQYQDKFPLVQEEEKKVADIEKQLKSLKTSIPASQDKSLNPVYQGQQSTIVQLRAQVQAYAGELAAAQVEQKRSADQIGKIPAAEQQLQSLQRDRSTFEQTYELLAQRQTTAIHGLEMQKAPAQIVSPALPPSTPSFPDKKLLSLTGLALGVFFAVLILMPRPQIVTEVAEIPEPKPSEPTPEPALKPAASRQLMADDEVKEPEPRPSQDPVLPEPSFQENAPAPAPSPAQPRKESGAFALSQALTKAKSLRKKDAEANVGPA